MSIITTLELRKCIFSGKRKTPIAIARNGSFVGLYQYCNVYQCFVLYKSLNKDKYGKKEEIYIPYIKKPSFEYTDLEWGCNEFYLVPDGYDLRKKQDLELLINAFNENVPNWHNSPGANRSRECIEASNPNPNADFFGNIQWQYNYS